MKFLKYLFLFAVLSIVTANLVVASNSETSQPISVTVIQQGENPDDVFVTEQTSHQNHPTPPLFLVIPFLTILILIAIGPLFFHHFWEKYYPIISLGLGTIVVLYYIFVLKDTTSILHTTQEYISFIALLGSLFVASGGIAIQVDKKSTPMVNTIFLLIGSVLANVIGTTGASMLLIRPFLNINKNRLQPYHVVFFIFTVSNIGGGLTPIGDPPLFLGFLKGISFMWVVQHVWYIWLFAIILVLAVFYFYDSRNVVKDTNQYSGKITFTGLRNIIFLVIILIAVFIDPGKISWVPDLYTKYHIPIGIREIIQLSVMFFAYKFADKKALQMNNFNFGPIKEVAFLFAGIFAAMIPALSNVAAFAKGLGEKLTVDLIYWATGLLSGFLDNAPTYLNYLTASMAKYGVSIDDKAAVNDFAHHADTAKYIIAVSVASVFFGAMTYIGNGPNFMVKSICEPKVKMPSFFGYMIKYSVVILLPIYFLVYLLIKFVAT